MTDDKLAVSQEARAAAHNLLRQRGCAKPELNSLFPELCEAFARFEAQSRLAGERAGMERLLRDDLLGDEDGLRELALLYNHRETDEPQFTRWQMIAAMNHGIRISVPGEEMRPASHLPLEVKLAGADAITSEHMKANANYDAACDCWDAMRDAILKEAASITPKGDV